jgi:uncharacterized protein YjiS (DUF1127 family)
MTDIALIGRDRLHDRSTLSLIVASARTAFEVVREWQRRYRSRQALALFSYHERNDLPFPGVIDAEIAKPFWRR